MPVSITSDDWSTLAAQMTEGGYTIDGPTLASSGFMSNPPTALQIALVKALVAAWKAKNP